MCHRPRNLDTIHLPRALTLRVTLHSKALQRVLRVLGLVVCWGWMMGSFAVAQEESVSRSEQRAEKRRMKEAVKAEKKALKAFEKNYKEQQKRHYKLQQTGREKNLVVPDGGSTRTERRNQNHEKGNVRKRMRKGQQKARRHRDGRTVSWWQRLRIRNRWKRH